MTASLSSENELNNAFKIFLSAPILDIVLNGLSTRKDLKAYKLTDPFEFDIQPYKYEPEVS